MKVRPIDLSNLHPKLQAVLGFVALHGPRTETIEYEILEVSSTWRNDPNSVHGDGRGADIVVDRLFRSSYPHALKGIAKKVNEIFDYGKEGHLVAVDEIKKPKGSKNWTGPHIHLQVRDETSLR